MLLIVQCVMWESVHGTRKSNEDLGTKKGKNKTC